jgi:hypothetical protein
MISGGYRLYLPLRSGRVSLWKGIERADLRYQCPAASARNTRNAMIDKAPLGLYSALVISRAALTFGR